MEWDDNVLEENNMLISEWDSKSTNDTGQDIEKLSSSIELVDFMDQSEEAHGSVCNLEMDTSNALDDSLEEPWDQMIDLVDLTNLKDFLKFGQEEGLLDAVGKWPVL